MKNSKWGMSREEAIELMEQHLDTEPLRKHSLASEAIMRSLATRFDEDPEQWGLIGLLHDIDYNETRDKMDKHTLVTEQILLEKGVDPSIPEAIKYHNATNLGLTRNQPVHWALTAAETMTGMIVAATLVNPDKKLSSLKAKSVKKRMKAKEFARSVNRDHILLCEKIGLSLDDFIEISINAMGSISDRLGL
jgi:uncharacterized protein